MAPLHCRSCSSRWSHASKWGDDRKPICPKCGSSLDHPPEPRPTGEFARDALAGLGYFLRPWALFTHVAMLASCFLLRIVDRSIQHAGSALGLATFLCYCLAIVRSTARREERLRLDPVEMRPDWQFVLLKVPAALAFPLLPGYVASLALGWAHPLVLVWAAVATFLAPASFVLLALGRGWLDALDVRTRCELVARLPLPYVLSSALAFAAVGASSAAAGWLHSQGAPVEIVFAAASVGPAVGAHVLGLLVREAWGEGVEPETEW
jgi:hypothetical protein